MPRENYPKQYTNRMPEVYNIYVFTGHMDSRLTRRNILRSDNLVKNAESAMGTAETDERLLRNCL